MTIQALGPNKYALTKKGITAIISNAAAVQQTTDGNFIAQIAGPEGVRLESYTPSFGYSTMYPAGNSGAVKNIKGTNDGLVNAHRNNLPLPATLLATDSLIITRGATTPGTSPRDEYWPGLNGGSEVDEMMVIVSVNYPISEKLFRPPAIGEGLIPRFLRSGPIPENMMQLNKLPSLINLSTLGSVPQISFLEKLFSDFSGDLYAGWECVSRVPDYQHPGYGTYFAGAVSTAMVMLCSTIPTESKRKLATSMVQWGLDMAGAWGDGRQQYNNGGHMQGRKALLILAGHLLNLPPLANPNSIIGKAFQEDRAYFKKEPKAWWNGWKYGYESHQGMNASSILDKEPSTWPTGAGSVAWGMQGYMPHVIGCQMGTALAMKLMGLSYEMGEEYMGMMEQWVKGLPPAENAKLQAIGVNLPWGESYEIGFPNQFNAKAWKQVYPN